MDKIKIRDEYNVPLWYKVALFCVIGACFVVTIILAWVMVTGHP